MRGLEVQELLGAKGFFSVGFRGLRTQAWRVHRSRFQAFRLLVEVHGNTPEGPSMQ